MKAINIVKTILRCLLGVMFIVTAVFKIFSLDNFEIYIYSFQIFSLALTAIIARCVIAFEILLGIFLILKLFYQKTWWAAMLTMLGFTIFLVFVAIFRSDVNCHCFGDIIPIDPIHSIIKNLIIIILLIPIKKQSCSHPTFFKKNEAGERCFFGIELEDYSKKAKIWITTISGFVIFVVTFVLFPPNALFYALFSENDYVVTQVYQQAYQDSSMYLKISNVRYDSKKDTVTFDKDTCRLSLDHGRYLVGIMTSGCKYCKQSSELIRNIFERNNLSPEHFKILIWGSDPSISKFIRQTQTEPYEIRHISPLLGIDMAKGNFPTFMLIENGEIIDAFNYRGISESQLTDFLKE